jgi:hypothetical protein
MIYIYTLMHHVRFQHAATYIYIPDHPMQRVNV